MADSGFTVDTDKLLQVADQVRRLREDLAGDGGTAGSLPGYQDKAGAAVLRAALATFWDRTDVFANAYDVEQRGIVTTMGSMLTQLQALENACRNTATQYRQQDDTSRTEVRRTAPGNIA